MSVSCGCPVASLWQSPQLQWSVGPGPLGLARLYLGWALVLKTTWSLFPFEAWSLGCFIFFFTVTRSHPHCLLLLLALTDFKKFKVRFCSNRLSETFIGWRADKSRWRFFLTLLYFLACVWKHLLFCIYSLRKYFHVFPAKAFSIIKKQTKQLLIERCSLMAQSALQKKNI